VAADSECHSERISNDAHFEYKWNGMGNGMGTFFGFELRRNGPENTGILKTERKVIAGILNRNKESVCRKCTLDFS
jgi:hypothetical protein